MLFCKCRAFPRTDSPGGTTTNAASVLFSRPVNGISRTAIYFAAVYLLGHPER